MIAIMTSSAAWAGGKNKKAAKDINMSQSFDNLGSNEEIIAKARALQPSNSMRIVQKREVDRFWRPEIGGAFGLQNGGDSYVNTSAWGANLDLHITPRWSVGLRYVDNKNELTKEGERARADFDSGKTSVAPAIDFPLRSYMAVLNWYPMYGKISWLEYGVSQFDFYFIGGGGQVELVSGNKNPIYTGGAGMGLWWSKHFTTRVEFRYQNYKDEPLPNNERNVNSYIVNLGIGFMI